MSSKQEKLPAEAGVTEVAPNVLRIQLPVRFTGLGHVNMYVLEDSAGATIIDPGLPTRSSWRAVKAGLDEADIPMRRIHSVLVTHSHPDHFGGVRRLLGASHGTMVAHARYRTWWRPHGHIDADDIGDDAQAMERRARSGVYPWHDPAKARGWRGALSALGPKNFFLGSMRSPVPDRRVADGEVIELGGTDWIGVHTPGHTGDHLCLFDPAEGTLITGDHVLPSITPHVGALGSGPDPLGTYLASLDKVAKLDVEKALPAHGQPFGALANRVDEIKQHHDKRLRQLSEVAQELGPATAGQFSQEIYPPRLWGYLAESETYAHLIHLQALGRAERTGPGGIYFSITADGSAST